VNSIVFHGMSLALALTPYSHCTGIGAQKAALSALAGQGKETAARLQAAGVLCDFREPSIIRAAPAPLYNTLHELWRFVRMLARA
jgi:kynureninase